MPICTTFESSVDFTYSCPAVYSRSAGTLATAVPGRGKGRGARAICDCDEAEDRDSLRRFGGQLVPDALDRAPERLEIVLVLDDKMRARTFGGRRHLRIHHTPRFRRAEPPSVDESRESHV